MHTTEKHLGEFIQGFGDLTTEQGRRQGIPFPPAQTAHLIGRQRLRFGSPLVAFDFRYVGEDGSGNIPGT